MGWVMGSWFWQRDGGENAEQDWALLGHYASE